MITQFPEYPFENPRYPTPRLTVDVVVMTISNGALQVMLLPQRADRRDGCLVLPSTFVMQPQAFEAVAQELIAHHLGFGGWPVEHVGVFSEPGRDPRGWAVSAAFLVVLDPQAMESCVAGRAECHVVSVEPDRDCGGVLLSHYDQRVLTTLDHQAIIAAAIRHLRDRIGSSLLAFRFLGEEFTMLELLQVHEAVQGASLDKSNFRKRMLASTFPDGKHLSPTGLVECGPHRPAAVYYLGQN